MKILAVETTGAPASVAILDDNKVISQFFQNTGFTHSRTLLPMVDSALYNAGLSIRDMDVFACAVGPGSFTGVRIGVATIKGFAFAEDKPCAAVSSLEGMAWNLLYTDKIICAVLDARAKNVYNALFKVEDGRVLRLCPDRAISVDALSEELQAKDEKYILVGDGALPCYNILSEKGQRPELPPENLLLQNAYGVARSAYHQAREGKLVDAFDISPSYLRLCQAEWERMKKIGG